MIVGVGRYRCLVYGSTVLALYGLQAYWHNYLVSGPSNFVP